MSQRSIVQSMSVVLLPIILASCVISNPAVETGPPQETQGTQAAAETALESSGATGPSVRTATADRPVEFPIVDRQAPVLPDGLKAVTVPVIERKVVPIYNPAPLKPEQQGITAFDAPGPADPSLTGRGRGFPAPGPVSAPAPSHADPANQKPGAGPGDGALTRLAPNLFASFDSTNFDDNLGLSGSYFIPPDPHGAAGINHVVNVVNTTIRFHTKAGVTTFHAGLASFFAPLSPLTATFDPKVIYDQFEDRFVVVTLEQTDTFFGDAADTSRIFLAVSDDGDPNGIWYLASIPVVITPSSCGVPAWADYPGFAVDEEAVYITNNMFGFFSNNAPFCGTRLWIVDKGVTGGFYAGLAAVVSPPLDPYAGGGIATTSQPAHVFCTPGATCPATEGTYLVSYSGLTNTTTGIESIQSVRVDNPLGVPVFFQQFVAIGDIEPLFGPVPPAPQSVSAFPIATNDRRALNAVWRDDNSLWMTTTIDPNTATSPGDAGEATAFWLQLDTSLLGSIALTQFGAIGGDTDIAPNTYTFFPSIAVNSANDVAIGFSASAPTIFAGSYYTTRTAADPVGFTEPALPLRLGIDAYERTFDGSGSCGEVDSRWGDYSGISVDPVNECFWIYNEHALLRGTPLTGFCGSLPPAGSEDGRWGTAHGQACICDSTLALSAGLAGSGGWQQISLPCDPGSADTVAEVIGDDLAGTYGTDWIMYRRDETTTSYIALATTDTLVIGEGYWIKTLLSSQSISIGGKANALTDIPLTGVVAAPSAGCASSAGQCNKVGHPHNFNVCWANVLVDDGGTAMGLATADPGGACQTTGTGCIMSRIAHKWTGGGYAPFDGSTPGMEGTLTPWDGFFVSANKPGIKLRIPPAPGGPGLPCGPPARAAGDGWFIRLIAESGAMRDDANVFGQLPDSVSGYDSHDLPELDPFGSPYLTIVFPHDDWGPHSGAYSSDYRGLDNLNRGEIWHFEVRASDPAMIVSLSWETSDGKERFRDSTLIDLETGQNVVVSAGGRYDFTMGAETHRFRWIQNR